MLPASSASALRLYLTLAREMTAHAAYDLDAAKQALARALDKRSSNSAENLQEALLIENEVYAANLQVEDALRRLLECMNEWSKRWIEAGKPLEFALMPMDQLIDFWRDILANESD